jgi:amino-acid N-acetyltransferase
MLIRPATVRDVPAIAALIATFAQRGKMLFRSHAELYEALRDFFVAEDRGTVVGVCALEIVWADLAEVRSLAVDPTCQGQGIGQALTKGVIHEARRLGIARVFSLTYEQRFFEKLGFHVVDKSALPLKVWSVCIKCPKRDGCDEIAMVKTVLTPAELPPPDPAEPAAPHHHYEVPTPLVQLRTPPDAIDI